MGEGFEKRIGNKKNERRTTSFVGGMISSLENRNAGSDEV